MNHFQDSQIRSRRLHSIMFHLLLALLSIVAADDCKPSTWTAATLRTGATPSIVANTTIKSWIRFKSASVAAIGSVKPGEVNCRYWGGTYEDVNYYTCTQLANKYDITIEKFFILNPDLDPDCGNIQPNTDYCVDGFIEPVRATDGRCGPPNNNATCRGYRSGQCCNAETWTCGNSTTDCARGTCYEGICAGDRVYSTDGTCGYANRNRLCAGKWGDCCNLDGVCGTGADFCGEGVCQSGNCIRTSPPPPPMPPLGNTTDGRCGGPQAYVCNVVYGNCCNKDGICGSLPSDCGAGCQPQFGMCKSTASTPTTASSSASISTASASQT
ncbi:carbohydrate-binding module family 18 protein [Hypoxylon sp. CO27-5]|nr:carbohydrate-binding module family 18 protein [Hypoxylon sp. CO27-5]